MAWDLRHIRILSELTERPQNWTYGIRKAVSCNATQKLKKIHTIPRKDALEIHQQPVSTTTDYEATVNKARFIHNKPIGSTNWLARYVAPRALLHAKTCSMHVDDWFLYSENQPLSTISSSRLVRDCEMNRTVGSRIISREQNFWRSNLLQFNTFIRFRPKIKRNVLDKLISRVNNFAWVREHLLDYCSESTPDCGLPSR